MDCITLSSGEGKRIFAQVAAGVLGLCLLCAPSAVPAQQGRAGSDTGRQPYVFGVFPFAPPETIEGVFAPLAAELSDALGRPVRFQTAPDFDTFMTRLAKREYDIAHIQPFDYVRIARGAGYELSAGRNERLFAVLVVRQESALRGLDDLRGKRLGTPPKVAAVTTLARSMLRQKNIEPDRDVKMKAFNTHAACLHQLLIGDMDACAVSQSTARLFEEERGVTFRVLAETPRIPHTLFVVHERVAKQDRDRIRAVLIGTTLSGVDPALRKLFTTVQGRPFRPIGDDEFRVVEEYLAASESHDR